MDRHKILDFPLNPTLTIVRQIFRRVIQCESKGVQSAIQRCQGYTVLYLQTCKDLCIVEGTGAGDGQPAPQSKPRELRQRARATCFVPVMAINKTDFLAGISFFYVPARFGADFLAAIEINRDLPLARTNPGRRAGTQSTSHRDLLTALTHPRTEGRHTIPLSPGFARLRSHIPQPPAAGLGNKQQKSTIE